MIDVTLMIRSGLPNPRWTLDRANADELIDRVIDGGAAVLGADEGSFTLGYDGFLVETSGWDAARLRANGTPTSFRVAAQQSGPSPVDDVGPERFLLGGARALDDDLLSAVSADLDRISMDLSRAQGEADVVTAEDLDTAGDEADSADDDDPSITHHCFVKGRNNSNFDFWNADPHHRRNNNCYNFSSAWRTNTFAQPGRGGTGRAYWENAAVDNMNAFIEGCFDDNFFRGNPCDGKAHYKLAAVIRPSEDRLGADYHFYRRVSNDANGHRWAHKRGQTAAKNTDESGNFIRDPERADRAGYVDWGGYIYHRGDRNRIIR